MTSDKDHSGSNIWLLAKAVLIVAACVKSYYIESAPLENFFPILYPVIFVLVLVGFGLFLAKAIDKNGYVSGSLRSSLRKNPFKHPLPFFMFAALVSLFSGVVLTIKYWGNTVLVPNGLIRISFSTAILLAIFLVTRKQSATPALPQSPK